MEITLNGITQIGVNEEALVTAKDIWKCMKGKNLLEIREALAIIEQNFIPAFCQATSVSEVPEMKM